MAEIHISQDHEICHHVITFLYHVNETNGACNHLNTKSHLNRHLGSMVTSANEIANILQVLDEVLS